MNLFGACKIAGYCLPDCGLCSEILVPSRPIKVEELPQTTFVEQISLHLCDQCGFSLIPCKHAR